MHYAPLNNPARYRERVTWRRSWKETYPHQPQPRRRRHDDLYFENRFTYPLLENKRGVFSSLQFSYAGNLSQTACPFLCVTCDPPYQYQPYIFIYGKELIYARGLFFLSPFNHSFYMLPTQYHDCF